MDQIVFFKMILENLKKKISFFIKRKRLKDKVRIEKGCIVEQSFFEGYNTVFRDCSVIKSSVGLCTYIGDSSYISNAKIGRFCSIAENVRIVIGNHPTSVFVTTFPSFYYNTKAQIGFTFHKGNPLYDGLSRHPKGEMDYQVVIGNDVWIGCNCIILGGVRIGDGAIIGAGAVVTKDVAPYSIVAGVPAKVIKFRFTEDQIKFLEKNRWFEWPIEKIKNNYLLFSNIDCFIKRVQEDES